MSQHVFMTGATGFIGCASIPALKARGHSVTALIRRGSEDRLPPRTSFVLGDPLHKNGMVTVIRPADTLVHLVGVSHPSPWKEDQFQSVDLASVRASVEAAKETGIKHFVYLSVAMPSPMMEAYTEVRRQGEALIRRSGIAATFLRPLYVIGPWRKWPLLLRPLYALLERWPHTRHDAQRLGLVTLDQMVNALVYAVETPPKPGSVQVLDVPAIQRIRQS